MVMMKEMVIVTSFKREVDFSTLYYIADHNIAEAGKKKTYRRTYLIYVVSIEGND